MRLKINITDYEGNKFQKQVQISKDLKQLQGESQKTCVLVDRITEDLFSIYFETEKDGSYWEVEFPYGFTEPIHATLWDAEGIVIDSTDDVRRIK